MTRLETERIVKDLKDVAQDAENLLMATAEVAGEKAHQVREKLKTTLDSTKASLRTLEKRAIDGVKATDQVIKNHPYQAMGVAFGVGTIVGALTLASMHKSK